MTPRPAALALTLAPLLLLAGCEADTKTKPTRATVSSRETIGKTTQTVLRLPDALQQGGVLAATDIPVSDPLTQSASAYRTTVGKIAGMKIEMAIQTRNASNIQDPKPLSYDEFMAEIIQKGKPEAIALPRLPYYQEYAWDEAGQKLVVVDFPKKKEDFQRQQDEKLGRR